MANKDYLHFSLSIYLHISDNPAVAPSVYDVYGPKCSWFQTIENCLLIFQDPKCFCQIYIPYIFLPLLF